MKAKHALWIRQGLLFAELALGNPLFAEHAPHVLTALGYRAYLRTMERYGHVSPRGYVPI